MLKWGGHSWLIAISWGFLLIVTLFAVHPRPDKTFLFFCLLFGLPTLSVVFLILRGRFTHRPGRFQVRLNDRGCVQYSNFTEPGTVAAWLALNGWLISVVAIIAVCMGRSRGWIDWWIFSLWLALALEHGIIQGIRSRRFRKALRWLREGYVPDLYRVLAGHTPWRIVSKSQLERSLRGHYHLRIERPRWIIFSDYAVDVYFPCTDEQASELKGLISQWRERARQSKTDTDLPTPIP